MPLNNNDYYKELWNLKRFHIQMMWQAPTALAVAGGAALMSLHSSSVCDSSQSIAWISIIVAIIFYTIGCILLFLRDNVFQRAFGILLKLLIKADKAGDLFDGIPTTGDDLYKIIIEHDEKITTFLLKGCFAMIAWACLLFGFFVFMFGLWGINIVRAVRIFCNCV